MDIVLLRVLSNPVYPPYRIVLFYAFRHVPTKYIVSPRLRELPYLQVQVVVVFVIGVTALAIARVILDRLYRLSPVDPMEVPLSV